MINNRFGWEGDFHVRERRIDDIRTDKPWDSNDCIADSWGYIPGRPVLSLRELVHNLISIVVRDGNYLLNVGPTGDGDMEPEQVERLRQLGDWLQNMGIQCTKREAARLYREAGAEQHTVKTGYTSISLNGSRIL